MNMNTTSIARVETEDAFPSIQASTLERLTHRVNKENFCEMAFIAVTINMITFLSYICYYALQNYGTL